MCSGNFEGLWYYNCQGQFVVRTNKTKVVDLEQNGVLDAEYYEDTAILNVQ